MDHAIKSHKEFVFGRLSRLQERAAACKAWLARRADEQAAEAMREARATPRRYLAPR